MTTDRPYREGLSLDTAIEELKKGSGRQFDPEVVDVFLACFQKDGKLSSALEEAAAQEAETVQAE